MALNFQFVPNTTGAALVPLDHIPDDVKTDVEEVYLALSEAGTSGRMRVEFPSKEAAAEWQKMATSYCSQRPDGVLRFRRSPTKGLAENVMDFTIKRDVEANGQRRSENADGSAKTK